MTVLLFDVDGVVLKPPQQLFSIHAAEKYQLPEDLINRFFVGVFYQCLRGELDLKAALAPELPMWGYPGSVEAFMQEWFDIDFVPDEELLAVVDRLRAEGYACHLATNQETHRAAYLWERLQGHFDGMFASSHLKAKKPDPEYFQQVQKALGTAEIHFWDDQSKNVEAAQQAGWNAHLYLSPEAVLNVLQKENLLQTPQP
ncbi:HAD-IA family hydrolase [Deinococcus roseus]|uniref:Haloacid dehalogenase n=1 Tax=Deinococcus roseus TaxID=392414 RepID=A0ABQ2D7N2_9DEIO|nr:HAD-IA family hydrolase [Deinococcus roseus]GGJ48705.1 hypothetical protein GCM10008938_38390 [Deinococcus roseus]